MFFVGIDVSKFKHDCIIVDDSGKVVTDSFTVHNNAIGFAALLNALSLFPRETLKIGFESLLSWGHVFNQITIHFNGIDYVIKIRKQFL